jgi:hypothetical protein
VPLERVKPLKRKIEKTNSLRSLSLLKSTAAIALVSKIWLTSKRPSHFTGFVNRFCWVFLSRHLHAPLLYLCHRETSKNLSSVERGRDQHGTNAARITKHLPSLRGTRVYLNCTSPGKPARTDEMIFVALNSPTQTAQTTLKRVTHDFWMNSILNTLAVQPTPKPFTFIINAVVRTQTFKRRTDREAKKRELFLLLGWMIRAGYADRVQRTFVRLAVSAERHQEYLASLNDKLPPPNL